MFAETSTYKSQPLSSTLYSNSKTDSFFFTITYNNLSTNRWNCVKRIDFTEEKKRKIYRKINQMLKGY